MQNNFLNDEKIKIRRKNKSGKITKEFPNVTSRLVKVESEADKNVFSNEIDASRPENDISVKSIFPNPHNHRKLSRSNLTVNERMKRTYIQKGNSNIISQFKVNSTTKSDKNAEASTKVAQNIADGIGTNFDKSHKQSTTTKAANKTTVIKKDIVSNVEEQNLKLKVRRRTNKSHDVLATNLIDKLSKSVSDANTQHKKTNSLKTVKKADIIEGHTEIKKRGTELKSHKTKIKMGEKENVRKIKSLAVSSLSERSIPISNERQKKLISEPAEKRRVAHTTSSKKGTSVRPSSIVCSSLEIGNEKIDGKVRERTKTWTISSTCGEECEEHLRQVENDSCHQIITILKDKESELFCKKGDELRVIDGEENIQMTKMIKTEGIYYEEKSAEYVPVTSPEEYVYEDDFEEYESDFEECSEEDEASCNSHTDDDFNFGNEYTKRGEEADKMLGSCKMKNLVNSDPSGEVNSEVGEKKMDTTRYDLGVKKQQEDEEASSEFQTVDTFEGFDNKEETRRLSNKLEMMPENNPGSSHQGCVNCTTYFSKRKPLTKKEMKRVCRRGKKLLEMITLDDVSFSLFELPCVPYETLIKNHGHINTKQVSVQTNEDSCTEGIQTNLIMKRDVWTQRPPVLGASGAVGEDLLSSTLDTISWNNLGRFVEFAGEVMIIILEEQWTKLKASKQDCLSGNSFSRFSTELGQDGPSRVFCKPFHKSRPVRTIRFCEAQTDLLVCVHGPILSELDTSEFDSNEEKVENAMAESSILSIWSAHQPSHPLRLLSCQGNVSRACFGGCFSKHGQLVFAGTDEGTICVWDFSSDGVYERDIFTKECHKELLVHPSFSTNGEKHLGRIVGLEPVLESKIFAEESSSSKMIMSNQVCSLDEWGTAVIWSVIRQESEETIEVIRLIPSVQYSLGNISTDPEKSVELHGSNLEGHKKRPSHRSGEGNAIWKSLAVGHNCVIAGSDSGSIVCLPLDGDNRSVQIYPGSKESFASAECIAVNPQGLPFFMVGNSVGQVCLYCHNSTKQRISWEAAPRSLQSAITSVAWSPHRPFVFFTADDHSSLTVWDLKFSDIFPFAVIPAPKGEIITALSLSFLNGNCPAYMAVGNDLGHVTLHQLKDELSFKDEDSRRKEVSLFLKYANLL